MSRSAKPERGPARSSRRGMLKQTAVAGAAVAALGIEAPAKEQPSAERAVKNGRIKQSIVYWCFEKYWECTRRSKVAKQLGCVSIELMAPKFFPLLKQAGLNVRDRHHRHGPRPAVRQGVQQPQVPGTRAQGHHATPSTPALSLDSRT